MSSGAERSGPQDGDRNDIVGGEASESEQSHRRLLDRFGAKTLAVIGTVVTVTVTLTVERAVPPVLDYLSPSHRSPLSVAVVHAGDFEPSDPFANTVWVLPMAQGTEPTDLPAGLDSHGLVEWAKARGAVPGGSQTVRLVLRGRVAEPVLITRIVVVPRERTEAQSGWYWIEDGIGGFAEVRELRADLDCGDASALLYDLAPASAESMGDEPAPFMGDDIGIDDESGLEFDVPESVEEALALRYRIIVMVQDHLLFVDEFITEPPPAGADASYDAEYAQYLAEESRRLVDMLSTTHELLKDEDVDSERREMAMLVGELTAAADQLEVYAAVLGRRGPTSPLTELGSDQPPSEEGLGSDPMVQLVRPVAFQVSRSDTEQIDLTVEAEQYAFRWSLEISYEFDGQTRTAVVDDESFSFTSLAQAQRFDLSDDRLKSRGQPSAVDATCGFSVGF